MGEFVETGNYRYVTAETFRRLRCTELQPGDLLVARMPDPIGRAWYVTNMPWRMITAVDVAIVRTNSSVIESLVLAHAWNSTFNLNRIAGRASGTTRARITRRQLLSLPFVVPPLDLQKQFVSFTGRGGRIAKALQSSLDSLRSTRNVLLAAVQAGGKDLMRAA